ncbi:hypothetical protein GGS24DRAFT_456916 [Hypoxylon argillaceum]|nr:hypothetical protein GGS24DRAFT_456916 [Hypoxylon argillaceum]KAI1148675.1 hypothetical protein F4825DRAFT_88733 [Nemania diffusa]
MTQTLTRYDIVASANQPMKDGPTRDGLLLVYHETEATGLINNFSYLSIRRICHYCNKYLHTRTENELCT